MDEEYFMKDTPYATRNQNGVVTFFDTVEEAVADFIGYNGYRLDIEIDGAYVYFYRDELPIVKDLKPGSLIHMNPSKYIDYESKIVVNRK
jgi:hypothetical protein